MKTFKKLAGIIAVITIIGLIFLSCEEEADSLGNTSFGKTLKLSGQVNVVKDENIPVSEPEKYVNSIINPKYEKFKDTLNVIDIRSGTTGEIKAGILNFRMETPADDLLDPIDPYLNQLTNQGFKEAKANKEGVYCYIIPFLNVSGSEYKTLIRANQSGKFEIKNFNFSGTLNMDEISYIYVTDSVKITLTGDENQLGDMTIKTKNGNLSLQNGWNTIKISSSGSSSGSIIDAINKLDEIMSNPEIIMKGGLGKSTATVSVSTDDAGTKWILK